MKEWKNLEIGKVRKGNQLTSPLHLIHYILVFDYSFLKESKHFSDSLRVSKHMKKFRS